MRQGSRMTEAPKEGNEGARPDQGGKEFTTKAEYNRALVRQDNWATAEEMRSQSKAGEEFIKERQRKHTTQGLSRQQAAAVQMKKASESLEAHREQNLTLGRAVYEEVAGWRMGAKAQKDEWSAAGKQIAAAIKSAEDRGPVAALAQLSATKKELAAATRRDDEAKAKAREELKAAQAVAVKEQAAKVKAETADQVTDNAKRYFYEQRLASATDTKSQQVIWEKERAAAKERHLEAQKTRRSKAKSARIGGTKSRQELITQRQAEAAVMREEKRKIADEHKAAMQMMYTTKAETVKGVIANSFVQPADTLDPASPASSFYSVTNIRSPSPERGGEER